jgi:3-mercaptopyruvate sulfurtransferase SseA
MRFRNTKKMRNIKNRTYKIKSSDSSINNTCLIDEKNIDKFLLLNGKFLFTDTNYKEYTNNHLINSIHFPSASLRNTNFNSSNICKNDGLVPLQYVNDNSISNLFINSGLSLNDYICVYGGVDEDVYACIFVLYTLYKFGFKNLYYLNCNWKKLPNKYFTLDFPIWNRINNEKFTIKNLAFEPDDVLNIINSNKYKLLDVRSPSDFKGDTGVWKIKGHIPGAYNLFWKSVLINENIKNYVKKNNKIVSETKTIATQKFINMNQIKQKLKLLKFNKNDNICVYCNTGSEGTLMFFVLKFLMKWNNIKLFEKSFGNYQYLHQICPNLYPIVK